MYCIISSTNNEGKLAIPAICVCDMKSVGDKESNNMKSVMSVMVHICDVLKYDVLYLYQIGNITEKHLEQINAVKNDVKTWFSLYNNRINISETDISVPIL